MRKVYLINYLLTLAFAMGAYAQDNTDGNEIAAAAWGEKKNNSSGLPGKECQAYMDNKGLSFQSVNKKGEMDYYFVGVGSIQAPVGDINFANSVQNGSAKAMNDAKAQFSKLLATEVISETVSTLVDKIRSGVPPEALLSEQEVTQGKSYEDLSSVEKMKLLIHQQLDKLIDQDTKDGLAAENLQVEELANKVNEIASQETFQQTIEAKSTAEMRGMLVKYAHYTADASRGNNSYVCVVSKWNPGYARVVDAIVTGNYGLLEDKRPKPSPVIPDPNTFKGFSQLLGSFGTYYFINENGELELWSFAQSAVSGNNIQAKRAAIGRAELKARNQISEFIYTSVDLKEKSSDYEATTNFVNEASDYYGESAYETRLATASKSNMSGIRKKFEYMGPHVLPSVSNEVAGIILSWTPSSDKSAKNADQMLANQPNAKNASFDSGNTDAVSTGTAYGDDEDENF